MFGHGPLSHLVDNLHIFIENQKKNPQNFTEYMDVDCKYSQGTGNLFSLQNVVTCL